MTNAWAVVATVLMISPPCSGSDLAGDTIPTIRALVESGAILGDIGPVSRATAPDFIWLPSGGLEFHADPSYAPEAPGASGVASPFLRHLGMLPSADEPFPGLPVGARVSLWDLTDDGESPLLHLQVLEGALLLRPYSENPDNWVYRVRVEGREGASVSGDSLVALARHMTHDPFRLTFSPDAAGRPTRTVGLPPKLGEMPARWVGLVETARQRMAAGAHPLHPASYHSPAAPYEESSGLNRWLRFDGPAAAVRSVDGSVGEAERVAPLWIRSFAMNDATSDRDVTAVLWIVDAEGRIIFEKTTTSGFGWPVAGQDFTGNGIQEVLFPQGILVWDGSDFLISTDPLLSTLSVPTDVP